MTAPMPLASGHRQAPSAEDGPANTRPDGGWLFTLVHGIDVSPDDQVVIDAVADLAARTGHLHGTWCRNDRVTFVFGADGGRIAVLALQAQVVLQGRFWWRTHTRFGGDA